MQSYRIAIGPQQGRKVFTLQSLPPIEEPKTGSSRVANVAGFSLHAGVMAEAYQREQWYREVPFTDLRMDKLERLCRYIARPAVSEKRLSLLGDGRIRYELKTPYRDGTTHVMLLRASCPPPFGPAFGCSNRSRRFSRTAGLFGSACCVGSQTEGQPYSISRGFRSAQQAPDTDHAFQTRKGPQA